MVPQLLNRIVHMRINKIKFSYLFLVFYCLGFVISGIFWLIAIIFPDIACKPDTSCLPIHLVLPHVISLPGLLVLDYINVLNSKFSLVFEICISVLIYFLVGSALDYMVIQFLRSMKKNGREE